MLQLKIMFIIEQDPVIELFFGSLSYEKFKEPFRMITMLFLAA